MKTFSRLFCLVFLLFSSLFIFSSAKEVEVLIPDYEVHIDNGSIYYKDSLYPFLNYKDITYFPMTYDYCHALNLASGYTEKDGLFIAFNPYYDNRLIYPLPIYETTKNKRVNKAKIADYPIFVNGRKIDNSKEEFPLLNFRDVTYFPLTYNFATEDFFLDITWENNLLSLKSGSYRKSGDAYFSGGVYKEDDGLYLSMAKNTVIPLEDGSFTQENDHWFDYLDYATGKVTRYDEFDETAHHNKGRSQAEFEIIDGVVNYKGFSLPEIEVRTEEEIQKTPGFSQSLYGFTLVKNGVTFLEVERSVTEINESNQYWSRNQYLYVLTDKGPVLIGSFITPFEAVIMDGDIYFSAKSYGQTVSRHYRSDYKLYKVSEGEKFLVNSLFPDYNSMKLLGLAKGKLYLKCEWAPFPGTDSGHEASPLNDGYFTFDGKSLTKIHPWIFSSEDMLTPDGDIYAVSQIRPLYKLPLGE